MNGINPTQKLPLISGLIGLGGMIGAVISLIPPAGALGPSIASGIILGLALHFNIVTLIALAIVSIALVVFIAALIQKNAPAPPPLLSEMNGDLKNLPIAQSGKEYLNIINISHGQYQEWIASDLQKIATFPESIIKYSEKNIFVFIKKTMQREYNKIKDNTTDPEETYFAEGTVYAGYCLEFSEDTITDIREAAGNMTSIEFTKSKLQHKAAALKAIINGKSYDGWTLA